MASDIFPIIRSVASYGHAYDKRIDEGDRVHCYMCGHPFAINRYCVDVDENEMQFVTCPKCRYRVSVLYYFDKTNLPELKSVDKSKKHETQRMYIRSEVTNKTYGGKKIEHE